MGKLCVRCGYERLPEDHAPETECPKCGVIYTRAEASQIASRQVQQVRLARAVRRQREYENNRSFGGFFSFGWMLTPWLVRAGFVIYVILAIWASAAAMTGPKPQLVVAYMGSILVVRIALEAAIVVFRLADDVSEVRALLTEQAAEGLR